MSGRTTSIAVALLSGVVLAGTAPAEAGTPAKRIVRIGDDYFAPSRLTVKPRTGIVWRWPGSEAGGQVHDVELVRAPRGVRHFHSESASGDYSFRRTLTVPGTYRLICSYHEGMGMTIRVRR